jgi:hypothetical protein
MHKSLVAFIALFIYFGAEGQIDEIRRITQQLCAPEFHGRGYVNKGDSIAANYLVEEFQQLGLEPFNGEYLQPFIIDQVNSFPSEMHVAINGKTLQPGIDFIVDASAPSFQGTLIPKEILGKELFDQESLGNTISQILSGNTRYNAIALRLSDLSADSVQELRGISQALAQYLPIIEITDSKFTWSVGRSQLQHTVLQIQEDKYSQGSIEVHIQAELLKDYTSQNVMAYLPAKRKCAKTIVFTAHYDHLGRMGKDTYFPGGNDNASGTAMLLTMAKHFKENPSKYNILFIAFAGEEAGLLGSKYFVENTPIKLKKIRFLLNLDIMGSGEEGITAVNGTKFKDEFDMLQGINTEMQLLEKVKPRGPTQNSDHYWFYEQGVPSFFIYTMGPNKNYHDIYDTYENLSFKEYEDITKLLVTFVERL